MRNIMVPKATRKLVLYIRIYVVTYLLRGWHMTSTAQNILEQVLEQGGFVQEGKYASGLINAESAKTKMTTDLRYRQLFAPSKAESVIDFVYEIPNEIQDVPGTPCIYFKALDEPSPEAFTNLRKLIWNQGLAPTLCIVTP